MGKKEAQLLAFGRAILAGQDEIEAYLLVSGEARSKGVAAAAGRWLREPIVQGVLREGSIRPGRMDLSGPVQGFADVLDREEALGLLTAMARNPRDGSPQAGAVQLAAIRELGRWLALDKPAARDSAAPRLARRLADTTGLVSWPDIEVDFTRTSDPSSDVA